MCGLVGFIAYAPGSMQNAEHVVRKMLDAMRHRGADGEQVVVVPSGQAVLAHRRLAIVSQEEHGIQPMATRDGRYTIVFNGEIYNYKELARDLKQQGLDDDFSTDTRVLVCGFSVWGKAVFNRLRGMFTCVIWDDATQQAFFVRDEFGIKPLYWTETEVAGSLGILFSSEIRSLLASGYVDRKVNGDALSHYLQYAAIHPPETLVKDIFSLEPATIMTVAGQRRLSESFWNITTIQTREPEGDFLAEAQVLRREFLKVCDLYTDIKLDVGIFLSGGIDSTALVGITKRLLGKNVQTFSLGFASLTGSIADESGEAQKTAEFFGTEHREIIVDGYMARLAFEDFVTAIDQPSTDGFNTFLISRFAGENVRVALSGLGGDEVFMGYRVFKELLHLVRAEKIMPPAAKNLCAGLLSCIPGVRSIAYRTGYALLQHGAKKDQDLYLAYRELSSGEHARRVLHFDLRSKLVDREIPIAVKLKDIFERESDPLNAFSKAELSFYIPGILARDTDAATMAATIEARVPFLDKQLVQHVVSLPHGYKCWPGQKTNKPLFVEAFKDVLPDDVKYGKKRGFEMPIGFWLNDHFKDQVQRLYDSSWLDHAEVERLREALYDDPREYRRIWSLMVLAEWIEQHEMSF